MPHRIRLPLPQVLPPDLPHDRCLTLVETGFACTPKQAQVVLAGVGAETYAEIGKALRMSTSTVRAHYREFVAWTGCQGRNHATALVVALLWQSVL